MTEETEPLDEDVLVQAGHFETNHSRRETVILIHGTFGNDDSFADATQELPWWKPGSWFVKALDAELEKLGSPARCWAHLTEPVQEGDLRHLSESGYEIPRYGLFSWSGKNSAIDRTNAAVSLAEYVEYINEDGWRFHFVAHSHGGNILIEAFKNTNIDMVGAWSLVGLGVPIFFQESRVSGLLGAAAYLAGVLMLLGLVLHRHIVFIGELLSSIRVCSIAPCSILEGISLVQILFVFLFWLAKIGSSARYQMNRKGSQSGQRWLFVNSDSDETLRLLKNFDRKARNLLPRPRLNAEIIGAAWGQAEAGSHFTGGRAKRHSDTASFLVGAAFVVIGWLVFSISLRSYESWSGYFSILFQKGFLFFIIGGLIFLRVPATSEVRYLEAAIHFVLLPYEWLIRGARTLLYILTFPARKIAHKVAWGIVCRSVLGFSDARARVLFRW
jgi:hypothetical protein